MELAALFPRHELPRLAKEALADSPDGLSTVQVAAHVIAAKGLDAKDRHLRKVIGYKVVQLLRRREKVRQVVRLKKVGTAIVWRQAN